MNELVSVDVRIEQDQMITDSRNIADVFGKQHKHILRDIENLKKDVPNFGQMFLESTKPDSYGREKKIYIMNRDGFTLLAMGFTGSEAMEWKIKYIQAFNELEKYYNSPEQQYARALMMAQKTIEESKHAIKYLKEENERMKPKEIFADAITSSKTVILIGELAKILNQNGVNTGEKRLFKWMRENGYLTRDNLPTQRASELKIFRVCEGTRQGLDGETIVTHTTKVTAKGQQYFINKFLANKEM